jgi:hypothetical protein
MPRATSRSVSGLGPGGPAALDDRGRARGRAARFAGVAQLLDEHHLVVIGDDPGDRAAFAASLVEQVELIEGTDVARLAGAAITDVPSFGGALARALSVPTAPRTERGLIEMLRAAPSPVKRRYVVWEDADATLERDVRLFGRLAGALLGAAAEHEHLSPDPLVLLRAVFLGGAKLGAYLESERGQFQSWTLDDGTTPFAEVAAILPQPRVMAYRLDG